MASKGKFYVVTMYRWGERENHSYIIGVFDKKHTAIKAGESHHSYRGGKYFPEVVEVDLNVVYAQDGPSWPKEIVSLKDK